MEGGAAAGVAGETVAPQPPDGMALMLQQLEALRVEQRAALAELRTENAALRRAQEALQSDYDALRLESTQRREDPVQLLTGEAGAAAAYLLAPSRWAKRMRDMCPAIPSTSAAWRPRAGLSELLARSVGAMGAAWRRRGDVSADGELDPVRDAPRASVPAAKQVSLDEFNGVCREACQEFDPAEFTSVDASRWSVEVRHSALWQRLLALGAVPAFIPASAPPLDRTLLVFLNPQFVQDDAHRRAGVDSALMGALAAWCRLFRVAAVVSSLTASRGDVHLQLLMRESIDEWLVAWASLRAVHLERQAMVLRRVAEVWSLSAPHTDQLLDRCWEALAAVGPPDRFIPRQALFAEVAAVPIAAVLRSHSKCFREESEGGLVGVLPTAELFAMRRRAQAQAHGASSLPSSAAAVLPQSQVHTVLAATVGQSASPGNGRRRRRNRRSGRENDGGAAASRAQSPASVSSAASSSAFVPIASRPATPSAGRPGSPRSAASASTPAAFVQSGSRPASPVSAKAGSRPAAQN